MWQQYITQQEINLMFYKLRTSFWGQLKKHRYNLHPTGTDNMSQKQQLTHVLNTDNYHSTSETRRRCVRRVLGWVTN